MSNEKSVVLPPAPPKHLCPVCGTPSYSRGGVHPQCAMQQADQPRVDGLRTARAAEVKTAKPKNSQWKKRCPVCRTESHVRLQRCKCGHKFATR